jgi:hypothetical protein
MDLSNLKHDEGHSTDNKKWTLDLNESVVSLRAGTVPFRFNYLINELQKRFPSPNPFISSKAYFTTRVGGNALDIGEIYFGNPNAEQLLDADTSPFGSPGNVASVDIKRRLSFKQAQYLTALISKFLNETLAGEIPPDHEIDELMKTL